MPADVPADSLAGHLAEPLTTAAATTAREALIADAGRVAAARRLQNALGQVGRSFQAGQNQPGKSTPLGEPLGDLADLAARLLGTASGRIALLSDVQQLLGAAGPQPAAGPDGEGPLAQWLCTQTVVAAEALAINDTRADERVAALSSVTSGVVGSYLGAPLRDAGGQVVGAVCVFEPGPRTWSEQDVTLLTQVATAATAQLELAALSGERVAERALLELTIAAAELGTFDLDLTTGELVMNQRLLELSELTADTFDGTPEDVYAHIHPEDREATIAAVGESTTHGGTYSAQYRIVIANGIYRWIAARGATLLGPDGSPARLVGAAYDVSAVRQAATRAEQMMDAMAVAYLAMDTPDSDGNYWPITYVNDEGQRIAAASREELAARS